MEHPQQYRLATSSDFSKNVTNSPIAVPANYQHHHIIAGSFRSSHLVVLEFSPLDRTLGWVQNVDVPEDAPGPYQYLGLNPKRDRVYTTSWALPPKLSSWKVKLNRSNQRQNLDEAFINEGEENLKQPPWWSWSVTHLNCVPITATSSYITIPPPYTHLYSMGGPTGEAHVIDKQTGAIGDKLQEVLFIPADQLEAADKTRVALVSKAVDPGHLPPSPYLAPSFQRTGSHAVEFSSALSMAFVPVLGTSAIEAYKHDPLTGTLTHLFTSFSPRGQDVHDGPRHVKIHPNGKTLYCITEHTNYIDQYQIAPTSLTYVSSVSLIPPSLRTPWAQKSPYRGDTLHLTPSTPSHPSPRTLFATTRGSNEDVKGWVSVFELDEEGIFVSPLDASVALHEDNAGLVTQIEERGVERYQTPTSGGKAHALDILPKTFSPSPSESPDQTVWILLTDDSDVAASRTGGGGVRVLEWDGWQTGGIHEVAGWPKPTHDHEQREGEEIWFEGGSHAVWLD